MSESIKSFRDLNSWKEAHKLVIMVYEATECFPGKEIFGLTNQMRRAVVSISSNIAEGFGRYSFLEKAHFYSISSGSLTELQNQLLISKDVGYLEDDNFLEIANQTVLTHKLITGLIRKTKERSR